MLGNNDYGLSCLKQLKGNIHIIRGNHCTDTRMNLYKDCWNVVEVCEGKFFRYKKYHFYLSHFQAITSNYDDNKSLNKRMWNLHGHTHSQEKFSDLYKCCYNCCVDAHNCYPIMIEDIITDIKDHFSK